MVQLCIQDGMLLTRKSSALSNTFRKENQMRKAKAPPDSRMGNPVLQQSPGHNGALDAYYYAVADMCNQNRRTQFGHPMV